MQREVERLASSYPAAERAGGIFRHVLVPIDFSDESHAGIRAALELGRRLGSEISVCNLTLAGDAHESDGRDRLRAFVDEVEPGAGGNVRALACPDGDIVRSIHGMAMAVHPTLVVLATHPRHAVLRSLIDALLQAAGVAALVIR